jgi:uncharacterized membrane protein
VVIKQVRFNPPELTVAPGDTVEWKNEDIFSHSATADDGSFDSGLIAPGRSWKTTFNNVGKITYHCYPHPNMSGSIVVASGAGTSRPLPGQTQMRGRVPLRRWVPPTKPQEIHPILVNFTAALLPLALLSDVLGRVLRRQSLHATAFWMLVYAAAITPLTVAAGWWWKHALGSNLPANLITVHQWLGTSAAALFAALAIWRWKIHRGGRAPGAAYLVSAAAVVAALVYQGSIGGAMVFGR